MSKDKRLTPIVRRLVEEFPDTPEGQFDRLVIRRAGDGWFTVQMFRTGDKYPEAVLADWRDDIRAEA